MPPPIVDDLLVRLAESGPPGLPAIAARDQPFNPTDAIDRGLSQRRFILGGQSGQHWFVWYEHGGFSPHAHVVVYETSEAAGGAPQLESNAESSRKVWDLCRTTAAILDGDLQHIGGAGDW